MTEKFKDVRAGKKIDSELYKAALEEQKEKLERYKARVKASNIKSLKDDPVLLDFKIQTLKEQIDQHEESLHYAKQDLAKLMNDMDLSGAATTARETVENIEREIEFSKKELSDLMRLK